MNDQLRRKAEALAREYGVDETAICPGEHHLLIPKLQETTANHYLAGFLRCAELYQPVVGALEYYATKDVGWFTMYHDGSTAKDALDRLHKEIDK